MTDRPILNDKTPHSDDATSITFDINVSLDEQIIVLAMTLPNGDLVKIPFDAVDFASFIQVLQSAHSFLLSSRKGSYDA